MSRVIEALDRKRKCTNYRDGLSWRSIGGGDWLVHGPTPTSGVSGVCVSVCFLMQRDWMHQQNGFITIFHRRRRRRHQPADVGVMFRASVHPACSVFETEYVFCTEYAIKYVYSGIRRRVAFLTTPYSYPRTSEREAKAYGPCADRVNHR